MVAVVTGCAAPGLKTTNQNWRPQFNANTEFLIPVRLYFGIDISCLIFFIYNQHINQFPPAS
jgi:hypothetical protein